MLANQNSRQLAKKNILQKNCVFRYLLPVYSESEFVDLTTTQNILDPDAEHNNRFWETNVIRKQ